MLSKKNMTTDQIYHLGLDRQKSVCKIDSFNLASG